MVVEKEDRMTSRALTPTLAVPLISLVATVGMTGCDGYAQPSEPTALSIPNAALVANERTTVDTVVFDQGTGEDIALRGTAHVVFSITQSGRGVYRHSCGRQNRAAHWKLRFDVL